MIEIIVVESIIGIFLLLHIVRPYLNALRETDGFVFFPVIALLCCVAMIPAYGIRPECLPLFLFTLVYNVLYFPTVAAFFSHLKSYSDYDNRLPLSLLAVVLLAVSLVAAFRFSPRNEWPVADAEKPQFFIINDASRGVDLFVHHYQGSGNDLVLITPPVTMPLSLVEDMCFAFKETGYTVLAFSRPYFDNSAAGENGENVELPIFQKMKRYTRAMNGVKDRDAVPVQRQDATEREADIRFLLSSLESNPQLRELRYENIFLLGYGAGGAASVGLSGNEAFLRENPAVKAVAAIESVVLCDFSEPEFVPDKNILRNIGGAVRRFFKKPLPRLEHITHPEIPVLFVAGDGAQTKNSYSRYMAVVQTMVESQSPFLFASVNGIHPIDFSAFAHKYPVLPLFIKGKKEGVWPREDAVANTAAYIAAFFSLAKDSASVTYLAAQLANRVPFGAVFLETSRSQ